MTSCLVSIIIPVWNPGEFLRAALESVMSQTFSDWECVLVDDNSSEDISWVTRDFPKVRYLRQAHGGVSVARNNGIINTSGRYLAFMDQDDLWHPDKIQSQVDALESDPSAGVCYTSLCVFSGTDEGVFKTIGSIAKPVVVLDPLVHDSASPSALHRSLKHFAQSFVVPSTVMVRRQVLATSGLLDPFIPFSGDYDFLIKLGSRHRVLHVPRELVGYRKHEANFSDQYEVGRREVEALVARYHAVALATGDRKLLQDVGQLLRRPRKLYAAQAFDRARRSYRDRRWGELIRQIVYAAWFSPGYVLISTLRWLVSSTDDRK
jgi:glycosyltransferase involved in cell wall biosynthesis